MPNQSSDIKINFSLARPSRAKYPYICTLCSSTINQRQLYYRLNPHPMSKYFRGELPTYICLKCAGEGGADLSLLERKYSTTNQSSTRNRRNIDLDTRYQQLALRLDEPIQVTSAKVHIINITSQLLNALVTNPEEIYELTPNIFEELVSDRLEQMGFNIERVGSNTFRKDGGIDIIAYKVDTPFPFFMAVQVKHHRAPDIKTGPDVVRELYAAVQTHKFNAGAVVTNTTFTPDAQFFARHHNRLLHLKDIKDIRRWLQSQFFLNEYDLQEMPYEIEVCPGVTIQIPRLEHIRQYIP